MAYGADRGRQRRCGRQVTLTCACTAAPYPARKVDNISHKMKFWNPPTRGLAWYRGSSLTGKHTKTHLAVRTIFKKRSWKHSTLSPRPQQETFPTQNPPHRGRCPSIRVVMCVDRIDRRKVAVLNIAWGVGLCGLVGADRSTKVVLLLKVDTGSQPVAGGYGGGDVASPQHLVLNR